MRLPRFPIIAIALTFAAGPRPSGAQGVFVQAATPDADALAAEMRLLATNPSDLGALIRAGELTLKLDDATAAAGFFARAERIDPNDPRIKAGKGSLLVQSGRPGEALRQFAEAERLRGDVRRFAADRGLAFDLIGEQERAQRDYRLALKDGPADETLRRYALSLGISGKRDEALAQIDALVRRSDRGAWRARAFILAMTGDARGAERIATSMMPGGLAQGLQPFFGKLPTLGAADRAFAVHFGEVRSSPQRLADARLAPSYPPLAPEAGRAPVVVLAAVVPTRDRGGRNKEKRERKRGKGDRIEVASIPPPVPLPQPPAYRDTVAALDAPPSAPLAGPYEPPASARAAPVYVQQKPPVVVAANPPVYSAMPVTARERSPAITRPPPETDTRVMPAPTRAPSEAPFREVPAASSLRAVVTPSPVVIETRPEPAPVRVAGIAPATPETPAPRPAEPATSLAAAGPAMTSGSAPSAVPATILPPAPGPATGEDPVLAKIIANITVPGAELDVPPVADRAPPPAAASEQPDGAALQATIIADQKAADKLANDKNVADAKKLADKKLADKKLAEAKKLADAKKAEEFKKKNDPKILEPSRIWVQVAGGANEGTLPKEWARVRDKAPAAFKGRSGWTTPLRLTNRVLAGPFKSDAEARSFVNALAKEGVSAFTFTSDAGQKVAKLAAK